MGCNVVNCNQCNTVDMCVTCVNNLVPNNTANTSSCQCVDTTFIINSTTNTCVCPVQTLLVNNTCKPCGVQYCSNCPTISTCSGCNPTF